jgi:cytochrome c553
MPESKKTKKSSIPAPKWRDLSEEMLRDPEAYYAQAKERAAETAQKTIRERHGSHLFGRSHRVA